MNPKIPIGWSGILMINGPQAQVLVVMVQEDKDEIGKTKCWRQE